MSMEYSDNQRFFFIYDELKKRGDINTYVELASCLNTNKAGINDLKSEKKKLSLDNLRDMKKSYPIINTDYVLTGKGDPLINEGALLAEPSVEYVLKTDRRIERQYIPLYDVNAAAGLVAVFNGKQNIIDYLSIPNMPPCDGAITASGDSMYPLVKAGDIIAYKQVMDIPDAILWGQMYVLSVWLDQEDYVLIKYIQKSEKGDDYIKLVSQNQHHAPKDIKLKSVKALGLIKATIRFNTMN